MLRRFFALALFAAFAAGVSFTASADPAVAERSISIVASEVPGAVKLVFGEAPSQDTLYLHAAYGTTDGGDTPGGWEKFTYVADIPADMTEYECILPSGWGTKVKAIRYFLTTEKAPYDTAYEYIQFNGNNSNGSYFKTDYTPIPSKTHVVTDFTLKSTANMALFCSRGSTGTFTQFHISGTGFRFDCGPSTASKYQAAIAASQDTQYLVESGPNLKVSWEGGSETNEIPTLPEGTNFTAATVMYLFASHSDGSGFGNYANGEARSVRIYEGDSGVYDKTTLVHEYIPVKNPATGVGALYDTVTHEFLEHKTSGDSKYGCVYFNEQQASYEYETAGSSDTLAYVPRTLKVVSVASAGGTTKVTLEVSAGDVVGAAVAVGLGDYDYGVEFSDWPTNEILSVVSSSAQQIEVGMSSCWNMAAYSSARFFLVHPCSETMIDDMAQTVTAPVFASHIRARVSGDNVNIEVSVPNDQKWYVYAVYGDEDKGLDPTAWGANVVTIENGSGTGPGSVVWTPPARWRKTMKVIRFFLSSAEPMTTYEYLKGDGKAYIDLERKGVFGDMVALKYRHNAGGSGNSVFGARKPNTEGAAKDNFSVQAGATVYVDYSDYNDSRAQANSIDMGDTNTWISVVSSPTSRQIWLGDKIRARSDTDVKKPFETADNLCLFNIGGYNGNILNACIKDFELRHIEGSVTNDVMRLVPVMAEDGTCGMYDKVRMKFLKNAASTGSFSVAGAAATGTCVDPGYKMSGVSDPVNRGGLVLMIK